MKQNLKKISLVVIIVSLCLMSCDNGVKKQKTTNAKKGDVLYWQVRYNNSNEIDEISKKQFNRYLNEVTKHDNIEVLMRDRENVIYAIPIKHYKSALKKGLQPCQDKFNKDDYKLK